ncbi:MAG: CpsD/CapB family tyrosine-protein kinase [Candidatus Omnitrophica bacterium]|nr:CpsD/CapB family tyrosine-protein kinase [Candidatus Omnitrophota bacterium]
MGKITDALKKAAEERMDHLEKMSKIKNRDDLVVKKIKESNIDASIITYFDTKAVISEQYKTLRTNILSKNNGKPPKAFVITSALPGEGKTVTSLNIAISMAQAVSKPKILLIDADLRKGRIAKYLGVKQPVGLSEILTGVAKMEDVVFKLDNYENLAFIASGSVPENPSELLASDEMRKFFVEMKDRFDHVIIDTSPIIPVTDASILGRLVDGLILVVKAGSTQRGVVKRALEKLHQSHSAILGHVLTNIEYHLPEYIYRYL